MSQHGIGVEAVRHVLEQGETIRSYPDDTPCPSRLVLAWHGTRPIHVVAADGIQSGETFVITVYEPTPALWEQDFRRKKP
ncbi:DUF4258 domain-containing protein [Rubrobacter marinus]